MTHSVVSRLPQDWPLREYSQSVCIGPLDWHVQVAGSGPTILLLHGTGSSAHSWSDLVPELMGCATVVVPDLPGHGFTLGATPGALSLPRIAAALDALLAHLDLAPCSLVVGHSAGAALGLRWALDSKRGPAALVGFNPSLIPPPAAYLNLVAPFITPVATSSWATTLLASLSGHTRMVGRLLDSTGSSIPQAQRERYATLFRNPHHVRGAMGLMAGADLASILESGSALKIPLQFVIGSRDHWVPPIPLRKVLREAFPHAAVVEWQGGHLLHEAAPADAAHVLIRALSPAAP